MNIHTDSQLSLAQPRKAAVLGGVRLITPFPLCVPGERSYFVVYPQERLALYRVAEFRRWLLEKIALDQKGNAEAALARATPGTPVS